MVRCPGFTAQIIVSLSCARLHQELSWLSIKSPKHLWHIGIMTMASRTSWEHPELGKMLVGNIWAVTSHIVSISTGVSHTGFTVTKNKMHWRGIWRTQGTAAFRVLADDTDVFVLLLYFYNRGSLHAIWWWEQVQEGNMLLSKQLLRNMRTSFNTCSCSDTHLVLWGMGKGTVMNVL